MDYWKGEDYELSENRILILGESTYKTEGKKDPRLQIYVQQWIAREVPRDYTFARICNSCSGIPGSSATSDGRARLWNSIAFYNFVVDALESSRKRPTKEQLESSKPALVKVLDLLKPKGVWILGVSTTEHAKEVVDKSGVTCLSVKHPASRGLKNQELTASWNNLLGLIKARHQQGRSV